MGPDYIHDAGTEDELNNLPIDPYHAATSLNQHCLSQQNNSSEPISPTTNMENQNDRPPLTTLNASGKYVLKMSLPKEDKVKVYDDGVSARLFFKTAEGLCFSKSYGTKYGKSLAMLVGKISGKYVSEPKATLSVPDFLDYLRPATNVYFEVEVEVTPDGEWQGKPQFKYKLNFPKGKASTIPTPTDW